MSLLQNLPYVEYQKAVALNIATCEIISNLANLKINFNDTKKPGDLLMKSLDKHGYTVHQFRNFWITALDCNKPYKPQCKVAILIGNNKYNHLSKLVTPSIDCDCIATILKSLGFIVVIIQNLSSKDLKSKLTEIFAEVLENSYFFIFYAGHGCELCNTKCMLGVDCPTEDIDFDYCITENWILSKVALCKPELCVLILDMCRVYLDRKLNPKIYAALSTIENYTIHGNLFIAYSTQTSQAAYEVLQIECSSDSSIYSTYEVKTGDTERIVPGVSQYVNALCSRLTENIDVSSLLDKVHSDIESCIKRQTPIKVQCGISKRSLYDPIKGDSENILNKLKEILANCKGHCVVI